MIVQQTIFFTYLPNILSKMYSFQIHLITYKYSDLINLFLQLKNIPLYKYHFNLVLFISQFFWIYIIIRWHRRRIADLISNIYLV